MSRHRRWIQRRRRLRGGARARRPAVLPQQAALRRPGRLRPAPEPRAGPPRPRGRGLLRPALPRARRGRAADRRCRASTSTASPTRSGPRAPPSSATWSTWRRSPPCGRPASPSRGPSACGSLRLLRERAGDFDVVHDNQTLGYGAARRREATGLPLVAHDPPPDHLRPPDRPGRRADPAQAADAAPLVRLPADAGPGRPASCRRSCTPSEPRTARHRPRLRRRPGAAAGHPARRRRRRSSPPTEPRVPGRILAMASADAPMKGIATLLEAFAKLRTERPTSSCSLVTKPPPGGPHRAAPRPARDSRDTSGSCTASATPSWSRLMGSAEVACVPSPLRGLLAADRRADGLRDAAGGLARRRDPRGRRSRRAVRRPGHARRRRRAGGRARRPARRPRAPGADAARPGAAGCEELFSWRAVAAATAAATTRRSPTTTRPAAYADRPLRADAERARADR